jgi:DNA polymerase sigma
MTPSAQYEWHGHAHRPAKLTNNEKEEILARARQQRFDNVNNELIEFFQFYGMAFMW